MAHMNLSGRKFCDFVVWTLKGLSVQRIPNDIELWNGIVAKAYKFFKLAVIPEILGNYHSKSDVPDLKSVLSEHDYHNNNILPQDPAVFTVSGKCYCGLDKPDAQIIQCEYSRCKISLFHISCLQISKKVMNQWYCPDGRKNPAIREKKKGTKRTASQ